jgi:hypothetical protein
MAQRKRQTKTFSARFDAGVIRRLNSHSGRLQTTNARVAERLIDEGLKMEEFPGLVFRVGPTGRRAGVAGGPDVWEIIRDLKKAKGAGSDDPVATVSEASHLDRSIVELAASYYSSYREETDERIDADEAAAERLRRMFEEPAAAQ